MGRRDGSNRNGNGNGNGNVNDEGENASMNANSVGGTVIPQYHINRLHGNRGVGHVNAHSNMHIHSRTLPGSSSKVKTSKTGQSQHHVNSSTASALSGCNAAWRSRWVWLLIPGNIAAILALLYLVLTAPSEPPSSASLSLGNMNRGDNNHRDSMGGGGLGDPFMRQKEKESRQSTGLHGLSRVGVQEQAQEKLGKAGIHSGSLKNRAPLHAKEGSGRDTEREDGKFVVRHVYHRDPTEVWTTETKPKTKTKTKAILDSVPSSTAANGADNGHRGENDQNKERKGEALLGDEEDLLDASLQDLDKQQSAGRGTTLRSDINNNNNNNIGEDKEFDENKNSENGSGSSSEEEQAEEAKEEEEEEEEEEEYSENEHAGSDVLGDNEEGGNPDIDSDGDGDGEREDGATGGALSLSPQIYPMSRTKTFVNFRTQKCLYLCTRAKALGWKLSFIDFAQSKFPTLVLIRWNVYAKYKSLARTIINQVGKGSSCIGGGKGLQLLCREQLAERSGCDYKQLGIQPPQWNLQKSSQCEDFFKVAKQPENEKKIWIMKPGGSFHGRGITLHEGVSSIEEKYGGCKKKLAEGLIIQEYVNKPALMDNHKFDLRSYLLIASTSPFLAFYHDGFVRRSENPYSTNKEDLGDVKSHITNAVGQSSENHFFGFEQLEKILVQEHGFPENYFENVFRPHAMRVSNYLFHTAYNRTGVRIESRKGRFQLFALDWMIDSDGGAHLLEANGDPSIKSYPGTGLTPGIWDSMLQLIEFIHLKPSAIKQPLSVRQRFRYEGWRLIFNEVEAAVENENFDACRTNAYTANDHPLYGFST